MNTWQHTTYKWSVKNRSCLKRWRTWHPSRTLSSKISRFRSLKALWQKCVVKLKNRRKPKRNWGKKSRRGRKSMTMSTQSMNSTKTVPWRAKGRISYSRLQLEDFSMNMTNCRKNIRSPTRSSSLWRTCTTRLRESKAQLVEKTKKTLVRSWLASLNKARAPDRRRVMSMSWTKQRVVLARHKTQLCSQTCKSRPRTLAPSRARALKSPSCQLASRASVLATRTRIDSSRPSTTEQTLMLLELAQTWQAGTGKAPSRLRISSSVSSLTFCLLQEWPSRRLSLKLRAMSRSSRPTTLTRSGT